MFTMAMAQSQGCGGPETFSESQAQGAPEVAGRQFRRSHGQLAMQSSSHGLIYTLQGSILINPDLLYTQT